MPHLADTKPHGKYHMADLDRIGGVPVVMAELLEAGLLHGDCLTVTGKTVAENLAAIDPPAPDGDVVHVMDDPIHAQGGIAVLTGSLAPKGAVVKVAGIDQLTFDGTARVFDGEDQAMEAILAGDDPAQHRGGHPLRGTQGRPGDAGDAGRHRGHEGRGPGRGLCPGHRRPVLRRDPRVLHRPRGARGGRRRAHRPRRRRRPHRGGRGQPHHRPGGRRTRNWTGGGPSSSTPRPATPPGCWPSSPAWSPGPSGGAITEA